VARETCDFVLRELTDPVGGFYSTQDADSEGVEGKFYIWSPAETIAALGAEAAKSFNLVHDISETGNFEGHNILNRPKTLAQCAAILGRDLKDLSAELAVSRARLLELRTARIHPALDDKVLVSWNGLMLDSLARAGAALGEQRYIDAARRAGEFLTTALRRPDGRLLHAWRHGRARFDAYLDDYAALANGLVSLYEATFEPRWLEEATRLADLMLAWFSDAEQGGFFFTATDHEELVARSKDLFDNATPSGSSLAATALARLAKLTGRAEYSSAVDACLRAALGVLERLPSAAAQMLLAYDFWLGPTPEIVLVGDPTRADTAATLAAIRQCYWPNKIVALARPEWLGENATAPPACLAELFAGKTSRETHVVMYVCENFACQAPVSGEADAKAHITRLSSIPSGGL
jgi:uncharacterized protein YyaL (SSP411 family)